jgi:uncharacterized protein with HEPN domain
MPREELYLQDIIEAGNAIDRFLKGKNENDFLDSELLQSAVLHKLTIIGEAAVRISEDLKTRYPDIEWKAIIGFRNIAVHAYFSINWKIVWETATNRIAPLREQIHTILKAEFPDFELKSNN